MFIARALMAAATIIGGIGPSASDDRASGSGQRGNLRATSSPCWCAPGGPSVQRHHASELFAALSDRETVESHRLSKTQVELAARIDQLARDIQSAWLIRGLDQQPLPLATELAERLAERGKRLRAGVVWQAEAIALEGVLKPDQTKRLLRSSGRRPPRRMIAGYREFMVHGASPTENKGPAQRQVQACIAALANPSFQPSELFGIFLSEGDRLAPALSREQTDLIQRMDELNRDVAKAFLARGLEGPDLSPTDQQWLDPVPPKMLAGLSEDGRWLRISLLLRSEAIVLQGVLKPDQVISSKRLLWSRRDLHVMDADMGGSRGIVALLDPDVAGLLRLSKTQLEELSTRIDDLHALVRGLNDEVFSAIMQTQNHPNDNQFVMSQQAVLSESRARIRQAEDAVWGVLRTRQQQAFQRLVSIPDAAHPKKTP